MQIVVVSSLSGIIGTPVGSSYSASKFALVRLFPCDIRSTVVLDPADVLCCSQHGYFNALRSEVASHNVSVSVVCPGPVESEIADKALRNPNFPKQVENHDFFGLEWAHAPSAT